jgi:hypothetical protein
LRQPPAMTCSLLPFRRPSGSSSTPCGRGMGWGHPQEVVRRLAVNQCWGHCMARVE